MKSAVIYVRVSTEEQAKHGFSVETQTATCLEFAQKQGFKVIKIYIEEGLSAKDLNRPEAQKLLKYCNEKRTSVNAIIVWRLDRLSRFNIDYHGTIRPIMLKNNIKLLSATELNSDTIEGEYIRNVMMCNAEYELNLIRFRTRENMKTIARGGRLPAKAPIGYLNIGKKEEPKKIIIDEETAPYIKRAFELYATGMYSYQSLGDKLFSEGFKHPKTGAKYPRRKFEWMLKNPFYIGKLVWQDEMYEGTHTPIVSKDLYYRVQAMLSSVDKTKKHNIKFSYTNLIKCVDCGCYLTAEFKRGKNKRGHYIYYHCSNSKGYHKKLKSVREEVFDNTFMDVIESIHIPEEINKKILKHASGYIKEFCKYEDEARRNLTKQIENLNVRIKNSYIDKLEGRLPEYISNDDLNQMHREWQEEKDRLSIKLAELDSSSQFMYNRINLILNFSERLPELFAKGTAEEKKSIIKCMTNSVEYNGEDLIVELKPTFEKLRNVKKHADFAVENHNLRTLTNPLDATKKADLKSTFVNGAPDVTILEPFTSLFKIAQDDNFSQIESELLSFVA